MPLRRCIPITAFVLGLTVSSLSLTAHAQSFALNGQIEGIVTDQGGLAVAHAVVLTTNVETGSTRSVTSDESGIYRIPLLPPGTYRLTVSVAGFKGLVREGVTVAIGQAATVDLPLEPGEVNETITISADSPIADPAKTDLGRVMNEREVQNVPLVNRNPYQLGRLTANVNGRWNRGFGFPLFNANGFLRRVNYQIDGSVNTEVGRGSVRLMLISDIYVKEIQLITGGFAAEFGNTPGMIMNVVTPSGGNRLIGNVSFRFRRPRFYTRPFFFSGDRLPDSSTDDVTVAVGGPVIKDRWHFYFGYEHNRTKDNANADRLITIRPDDRDRLVAAGLSSSIFPASIPSFSRASFYIVRNDIQLNDMNRLAIRFNRNDGMVQNFAAARLNTLDLGADNFSNDRALSVQLVSYTDRLLNEFRFQYAERRSGTVRNEFSGTGATISIIGVANFGSPVTSGRDVPRPRATQFQNNITRTLGEHAVKWGGGFTRYTGADRSSVSSRYVFPNIDAYIAARSGANPYSYTRYEETFGEPGVPYSTAFWNAFAQHEWKATRRLKVNYGLRYDLYVVPKADASSALEDSRHFHTDRTNFAPRLGVVYALRPGSRPTVLRAGVGIYYDAPFLEMYTRAIQNNGRDRFVSVSFSPASPNAPAFPDTFSGNLPVGSTLPPTDIDSVAPDLGRLYALNLNLQIEQAITEDLSVAAGYFHSGGRHIPVYRNVNCLPTGGTLADGRPLFGPPTLPIAACTKRVFPQFRNIQMAEPAGVSQYDALNLQLTQRFSRGLQLSAHYTLSRAVDDAPEQNLVNAPNNLGYVLSDPTDRSRDKGYSLADQRHTFIMSLVARPRFSGGPKILNRILNNNQIGLVANANSGERFNILPGIDLNRDGFVNADRPVGIKRNSGKTPPQINVDLRCSRFIRFTERYRLEAFAEFQNLFNINSIVAFQNTTVPTDPVTGEMIGPLPDFKARNQSTSLDSRQFQLGLKFIF